MAKTKAAELEITEWDIRIVYGKIDSTQLPADFDIWADEGTTSVYVASVDNDICFSHAGLDTFVEEVAGSLDEMLSPHGMGEFAVVVRPRILRGALDRVDERGPIDLAGQGTLSADGVDRVVYEAPCGARYAFARGDLELVLQEFGG